MNCISTQEVIAEKFEKRFWKLEKLYVLQIFHSKNLSYLPQTPLKLKLKINKYFL